MNSAVAGNALQIGQRIVFAGGKTGGHLFPGLAVAEVLREQDPQTQVLFCGPGADWEPRLVRVAGFEYHKIPAAGLLPGRLDQTLWANTRGFLEATRVLQAFRPHAVVGLGGYPSVPISLAAIRTHIPLVLLEQNLIPGLANRMLAPLANEICISFSETTKWLRCRGRVTLTGNPIRKSLTGPPPTGETTSPGLLVLGGSQGSIALNKLVTTCLIQLKTTLIQSGWRVVHQTGEADLVRVHTAYTEAGLSVDVQAFISNVASVYSTSRLAVCRAGATTLAELAQQAIPVILVPLPHAAAGHQLANAMYFARAGAARLVEQDAEIERSVNAMAEILASLLTSSDQRQRMAQHMAALAKPTAAAEVANRIRHIVTGQ